MYIFCEDRTRPITSKEDRGYIRQMNKRYKGEARLGEVFTYQLCISHDTPLEKVALSFDDLLSVDGISRIPAKNMTCYNLEGVTAEGKSFKYDGLDIDDYQVFWIGVSIPTDLKPDGYRGMVHVHSNGNAIGQIEISLDIQGPVLPCNGYNELWRLSRLQWLNSTIAQDEEVVKGFTPVVVEGQSIGIRGRRITLNESALPTQITSYFNASNSDVVAEGNALLREPITFELLRGKEAIAYSSQVIEESNSHEKARIISKCIGENFDMHHQLQIEYDGYMSLETTVQALEDLELSDIKFQVPFSSFASTYNMGLGQDGGKLRPIAFKWNDEHQDTLWVGNINGGLSCTFKDKNYVRPFVNVYYNQRKRKKPIWDNESKGRITLTDEKNGSTLIATTGAITLKAGERYSFIVEFFITPFKTIDYRKHWQTRYYHPHENAKQTDWLREMDDLHCNYINIHHGQELHPFINYPFIETEALKTFIDEAHHQEKKVKVYYTLREITNHFKELWPFYSLGEEIFPMHNPDEVLFWKAIDPGKWLEDNLITGKRQMWVEEHIDEELIPAWQHIFHHGKYKGETCASILVNPISRLNNFYLEGLNWLMKHMDIDGIYVDDVAYDRKTMQRVRKILDQKEGAYVDLHSWNHMNSHAGMINCVLLYKELLPYMDSLWLGEGFDYDREPDYWMVEMSGMPFGLMGEMLQDDGHLYRGMVYGITNRSGWGKKQPTAIYKLWDEFKVQESQMKGYWDEDCPVSIHHKEMRATAYVKDEAILVAIGSWCTSDQVVSLSIDWQQLGLDEQYVCSRTVALPGYQEEGIVDIDRLTIKAGIGMILIISKS